MNHKAFFDFVVGKFGSRRALRLMGLVVVLEIYTPDDLRVRGFTRESVWRDLTMLEEAFGEYRGKIPQLLRERVAIQHRERVPWGI